MGLSVHCRCFLFPGSCDNWNFDSSNPCLYVGGNYGQNACCGVFYVNYNTASNYDGNLGCRFLFDFIQPHILRHRQPHTSR
nr:MAG TPA: hypothetical protein [Caudoviricetes sp.]